MINYYNRLLSPQGESRISVSITMAVLALAIIFPVLLSLTPNTPMFGVVVFGVIVLLIGLTLFFNIIHFSIYVFPLMFFVTDHRLIITLSILLVVAFIAGRLLRGKITLDFPNPIMLTILFLTAVNGALRGLNHYNSYYMFRMLILLPLVLFIIYYNLNLSNKTIVKNMLFISIFASITGWVSFANYFIMGQETRDIIGWYSQNPAACFFGMIMPFALVSVLQEQNKIRKVFLWVILVGIWTGIFVTQSRAIYITTIFTLGYIALKDKRALGVIMPILIAAVVILPSMILYRIMMMFGAGEQADWSSVGRVQIWLNSIQLIPEFFWFGMGIDSFRTLYTTRFPLVFISAVHPHNVYLRWLFEFGIFGVTAYVYLLVKPLFTSFKRVKKIDKQIWSDHEKLYVSLNSGMITALVASMFDSPFHQPQLSILLWMYVAFLLILNNRTKSAVLVNK